MVHLIVSKWFLVLFLRPVFFVFLNYSIPFYPKFKWFTSKIKWFPKLNGPLALQRSPILKSTTHIWKRARTRKRSTGRKLLFSTRSSPYIVLVWSPIRELL